MKKLYILMTLAMTCLLPKFALAKILSSTNPNTYTIRDFNGGVSVNTSGGYEVDFNVIPKGNSNEQDIKKCLTPSSLKASWDSIDSGIGTAPQEAKIPSLTSQKIASDIAPAFSDLKNGKITGALINKCDHDIKLAMNFTIIESVPNPTPYMLWESDITVPAGKTCGVELKKNYINLGTIVPGEPIKHGYVEFNSFTGSNNTVEITSSNLSDNKLKLGGSDKFIITVPTQHRKNPHTWLVDKIHYSLELIPEADRSLQPGTYTSNLDVSLTCQ